MSPETWAILLVLFGAVLVGAVVFVATVLGVRYALRTGGFKLQVHVQEGQPDPAHKD